MLFIASFGLVGWPVSGQEDEGSRLRDMAESCPTHKELRTASPVAALLLTHTRNQTDSWPATALVDGYLDALA